MCVHAIKRNNKEEKKGRYCQLFPWGPGMLTRMTLPGCAGPATGDELSVEQHLFLGPEVTRGKLACLSADDNINICELYSCHKRRCEMSCHQLLPSKKRRGKFCFQLSQALCERA